jgi:hypothetical protein
MTEAAEDRCWNCGVVPRRWLDVTSPGLDQRRLLCSNCFARTTRPLIYYGWPRALSPDWDDHDEDEKPPIALEPGGGQNALNGAVEGAKMAVDRGRRGGTLGGISLGGILVIVGIVVAIVWSLWLGIIIALVGLLPFSGFARGKWY